jgi:Cu(I)/Ag(I) efflux system membrane fusion protein
MLRAIAFSVLSLALVGAALSWPGGSGTAAATGGDGRKILYYQDPMHPAYTSDRPGSAPDCGMALVPVYEDSAATAVRVTPDMQRMAGVQVQTVDNASSTTTLRLYGRVAPDETRIYRVTAGTEGYATEIASVTTGSRVERGEWLATLAAPDARTPVQAYLVALDAQETGTQRPMDTPGLVDSGVAQAADRLMTLGMSKAQIAEIKRTRLVPPDIRVTAPESGYVLSRGLTTGRISIGDAMFTIADLQRVWVFADLPARDAEYVHPGTTADVTLPGRAVTLHGRISNIVPPQLDASNQSVRVRLDVDNPGALLRPDISVDVRLAIALPATLSVPVDAVIDGGLHKRVFVARGGGTFEPREVETGWRFDNRVQIVSGLSAGDRVVVSGTFLLDSETRLRRAPAGAPPAP